MSFLVLSALGGSLLSACSLQPAVVAPAAGQIGIRAPRLTGETLEERPVTIDLVGSRTVIVFWASWCGPCRHEQPFLTQMATDLDPRGVRFIGVNFVDHDRAAARAFAAEFKVPYLSLYDRLGRLSYLFEVDAPPEMVLVDTRSIIVARVPGETTADQLERLIQAKLLG